MVVVSEVFVSARYMRYITRIIKAILRILKIVFIVLSDSTLLPYSLNASVTSSFSFSGSL